MKELSFLIQNQLLIDLEYLKPNSKLEQVEILRYLHTTEKRSDKSFPIHECLAQAKIIQSEQTIFLLGLFVKVRKSGWELSTMECGDRDNPPHSPVQFFDCMPTSTEVASFITDRYAFEVQADQVILKDFVAGEAVSKGTESLAIE
jgi:hypothetical protein